MDYKGQIEALKNLEAIAYGYNIHGEVLGMDCSDFEQIMVDAADSITGLLARAEAAEAENTALRAEAERWRNAHHQAALNFQQENRECNKALSELEQIKAENAALRKMQPVQLDDASAQTMELAAVVSELRLKLEAAETRCRLAEKCFDDSALHACECQLEIEKKARTEADARAKKAEKALGEAVKDLERGRFCMHCAHCNSFELPIPEVCKKCTHGSNWAWRYQKEEQNSNDTNADTAAPDPVC